MDGNYELCTGEKFLKMDPKYRISIHGNLRSSIGDTLYLMKGEYNGLSYLKVLSREAYLERINRVQISDLPPADKADLIGEFANSCSNASINDQGKLQIPKEVSERADIPAESEVVLSGRGNHFEIWSKANFDKAASERRAAAKKIDTLGIFR